MLFGMISDVNTLFGPSQPCKDPIGPEGLGNHVVKLEVFLNHKWHIMIKLAWVI